MGLNTLFIDVRKTIFEKAALDLDIELQYKYNISTL
jgi:hypothetical protein